MKANQNLYNSNTTQKADLYVERNQCNVQKDMLHTYHVMPPIGWMNNPNGFCYALGKYHLFYQFHPYDAVWGPMHWGHYTTDDFIRWHLEPTAIAPDTAYDRDGCYSGTAIVKDNKMYLMYTSMLENIPTQSLACSSDGVRFEKLGIVIRNEQLPKNCMQTEFRDPKVFMSGGKYYSIMGSRTKEGEGQILLYSSFDLTNWEFINVIRKDKLTTTGIYECPDLCKIDGTDVVITSPQGYETQDWRFENLHSSIYVTGKLDTKTGAFEKFYEDEIDGGFDFYAPQTLRAADGRVIMIAWMQMWGRSVPTAQHGWAGSMTIPRELTLKDSKLYQSPVRELKNYRRNKVQYENVIISNSTELEGVCGNKIELNILFDLGTAQKVGVQIYGKENSYAEIYYDRREEKVIFDRSAMGTVITHDGKENNASVRSVRLNFKDNCIEMKVLLDVISCEIFLNGGERVMTGNVYTGGDKISFFAVGGNARIINLEKYSIIV